MVHGLALFSHSAEMEGEGRVGGQSTMRLGRGCAPSFASRLSFIACAPVIWNRGNAEDGLDGSCGNGKGKARSANRGTPAGVPWCESNSHTAPLEAEVNGERGPLVGRLALPRAMGVCGEMSHFGRSVRSEGEGRTRPHRIGQCLFIFALGYRALRELLAGDRRRERPRRRGARRAGWQVERVFGASNLDVSGWLPACSHRFGPFE
jgi:hypothetical protein